MRRKDLVAMFMESPFYFDMMLKERHALIKYHINRDSANSRCKSGYSCKIIKYLTNNGSNIITKMIVGYFPPEEQTNRSLRLVQNKS